MNSLVTILNGTPVTTTLAIAEGTQVQHKNVLELVRTYLDDLKEFGLVAFDTRPKEAGKHSIKIGRAAFCQSVNRHLHRPQLLKIKRQRVQLERPI